MGSCLIFVPFGQYDEPEILRYAITSMCPKGADVRHYRPGGPNRLFMRDLNTIAEAASAVDLDLPLVQSVREVYRRMIDQGLTEHDHASLLLDLEARNAPHRLGDGPTTAPDTDEPH